MLKLDKYNSIYQIIISLQTDDQILLLQNCWAELLCLCIGWKSVHLIGEIRLSHGRRLSVDLAKAVRLAELIQKMLDFTDNLRNLEVDHYEFVSLKSLLLISPGRFLSIFI